MNPRTSHKIIAASGMAAAIAIGVAVFFMRSAPVAPAVSATAPSAPVAATSASVPEVASEQSFAPAPAAVIPAAPAVLAQEEPISHKGPDRAVPPVIDTKPVRARQVATVDVGRLASPAAARGDALPIPSRLPVATDRVEVVAASGEIDRVPMSVGTPEAAASAPVVASDTTITTAVKSAIASEGLGKDSSIGVTTTDGVVALSGSVPSQSAIDQVKDVAGKVSGVKLVDTSGLILASL